ncbi:MAG: LLM class F420-dependent oxidoreductase [Chloroflexi bacterium]|nr:LLM class F420-dependent oxidoreductase [Chloroflexota bacterium]
MRVGVVFPQTEISSDPVAVRDYAQAAEDLGYAHLVAFDHVVGADPTHRPGWRGAYTYKDLFHEPLVLFGYLAGVTRRLELVSGIIILPQRQTVLVAKQAAEVDVLSGGRLRFGVGIGWNAVEYEALGENFHDRGKRSEEQVQLLRLLWTQEVVTFKGRWHQVTEAGLNPLPVQRPIPIWLGGSADAVLRRAARLAEGWFPQIRPDESGRATVERLKRYVHEAGRDPRAFGIEGRMAIRNVAPEDWGKAVEGWKDLGVTHLAVNTMNAGLTSPQAHIDAIRRFAEVAGL